MPLLNSVLTNIKSVIFNKDEADSEGKTFTEAVKQEYIVGYLFNWIEVLTENPLYLIILNVVEYDLNISEHESVKAYLNKYPKVMRKLLKQSNPDTLTMKSCSLPSITLVNSFVKQVEDKKEE